MNRTSTAVVAVVIAATAGLGVELHVPTLAAPLSNTPGPVVRVSSGYAPAAGCDHDRVAVIGHRGTGPGTRTLDGASYSEDTVGAFRAAVRAGADGFETDFWPTADGEVVSHHDATLTRMTDGAGPVQARTAAEVAALRTDSRSRVPTFRETLDAIGPAYPDVQLQQEFKDGRLFSDELLLSLARLDREVVGDVRTRVLVTASGLPLLRRFHRLAPDLPLGLIERSSGRPRLAPLPAWVDVVLIELGAADAAYVRRAAALGHEVSLRKVDTVAQLREAVRLGATRVVTDRPEVVGPAC
jgi:glycerophosphoryl diester phosphodiesterase